MSIPTDKSSGFTMIPLDELPSSRGGKYKKYVQAAFANPGMAILVEGCPSTQIITQARYAKGVKAIQRKELVYVYIPVEESK